MLLKYFKFCYHEINNKEANTALQSLYFCWLNNDCSNTKWMPDILIRVNN